MLDKDKYKVIRLVAHGQLHMVNYSLRRLKSIFLFRIKILIVNGLIAE